MPSSLHIDEPPLRAADMTGDIPDLWYAGASGEDLDALKARTTPMDITNPFVTPHASCELACLATAISVEHRYDELHLHFPADQEARQPPSLLSPDSLFLASDLPQLDVTLSLTEDSEMMQRDRALLDLVLPQDAAPGSAAEIVLTAEMLDDWQYSAGGSTSALLPELSELAWEESTDSAFIWH